VALEELERVERSVSHLLRFARDEEMTISEIRLADVVDSALETFRDRIERKGVELNRQHDGPGVLEGDPEQLRRVAINLVGNALESLDEAQVAEPRVEVSTGESLAGTEVWLRVRDNGPGIDAEVRERLFRPFQTSKPGGTGLGLAICRKLVDAHGGSIEVASPPGSGAEFVVVLPKRRRPREAKP
jgi:signal transduction histidine kinase